MEVWTTLSALRLQHGSYATILVECKQRWVENRWIDNFGSDKTNKTITVRQVLWTVKGKFQNLCLSNFDCTEYTYEMKRPVLLRLPSSLWFWEASNLP